LAWNSEAEGAARGAACPSWKTEMQNWNSGSQQLEV